MAAPAYLQNATSHHPSVGTTFTPTFPAGITAGNLLVMFVEAYDWNNTGGGVVSTPSGWTQLVDGAVAGGYGISASARLYVFYKKAAAGETAPTLSCTKSSYWTVTVAEVTGQDATTPIDGSAQLGTKTTSASVVAPAITTTAADRLVVHFASDEDGGASSDFSSTAPPGTTQRFNVSNTTTSMSHVWADETAATAGAVSSRTFTRTGGTSRSALAITFAIASNAAAAQTTNPTYIAAATTVHPPALTQNEAVPYIDGSTITTLYTPTCIVDLAAPFINAGTTLYTPALANAGIGTLLGQSASISI